MFLNIKAHMLCTIVWMAPSPLGLVAPPLSNLTSSDKHCHSRLEIYIYAKFITHISVNMKLLKPPLHRGGDRWEIVKRWKNGQISQRSLKERSTNAQGALNECSTISSISQRSLSDLSMNANFFHPEGEMAERSMSPQGSYIKTAF